jgi:hypothetical protein
MERILAHTLVDDGPLGLGRLRLAARLRAASGSATEVSELGGGIDGLSMNLRTSLDVRSKATWLSKYRQPRTRLPNPIPW